ncbi:MAG: hypothetical protein GY750_13735 [Lentisphaerae bacterium]|nr:hypothetical protein [Lentisphaerota bacterium]
MSISIVEGKFYADNLDFHGWSIDHENYLRSLLADVYLSESIVGKALLEKIENVAPLTGVDIIQETVALSSASTRAVQR